MIQLECLCCYEVYDKDTSDAEFSGMFCSQACQLLEMDKLVEQAAEREALEKSENLGKSTAETPTQGDLNEAIKSIRFNSKKSKE